MSDRVDDEASGPVGAVRHAVARVDERMAALRSADTRRRVTFLVALVAGLALAWVHWLGLIAGGALVGLTRRSLPRAVLAGLGFGLVVLLVGAVTPGVAGLAAVDAFAPVSYAAIAIGFVLPAWGALARGVV